MLRFENITSEADFVRAYRHEISRLMEEIRRYVRIHGFDQQKYDLMYSERLSNLYMGLSNGEYFKRFNQDTMMALAMLWHKEGRELGKALGFNMDDSDLVVAEYDKVKHHLDKYPSV